MIRSMYSGISGMKNFQTKLDVVGNNIANVNTHGFKKERVTFKDMISQTISSASGPTGDNGGKNPVQVGLGMQIGTIDTIDTQGALQTTGRVLDIAIQGDGYLMVREGLGSSATVYYTRAGNLYLNNEGYLVTGTGHYVLSYNPENNDLEPIRLNAGNVHEIKNLSISQDGKISFIKDGGILSPEKAQDVVDIIVLTLQKMIEEPTSIKNMDSLVRYTSQLEDILTNVTRDATFYSEQAQALLNDANATGDSRDIADAQDAVNKATAAQTEANNLSSQFNTLKQAIQTLESAFQTYQNNPDSANMTTLENAVKSALSQANTVSTQSGVTVESFYLAIDSIDRITANQQGLDKEGNLYTTRYSIGLARFSNPGGLEKVGDNLYKDSPNSGERIEMVPGSNGAGSIISDALEMSNVDLSEEFTEMIVAQRGFQANSRIITTSDEILQELINLKR